MLSEWISHRVNFKRTSTYFIIGLVLIGYTLAVHYKKNDYPEYVRARTHILQPIVSAKPEKFTSEEDKIIADIFPGGVEAIQNRCTNWNFPCVEVSSNPPKTYTEQNRIKFDQLVFAKLKENLPIIWGIHKRGMKLIFETNYVVPAHQVYPRNYGPGALDLPYRNKLYDGALDILNWLQEFQMSFFSGPWIFLILFAFNILVAKIFRYSSLFSMAVMLEMLVFFLFATGFFNYYSCIVMYWAHFFVGIVVVEFVIWRKRQIVQYVGRASLFRQRVK
jgi:hypothetical protein